MKNRTLLYLLFFQLITLTLFFLCTPRGESFMEKYFPSGNLREEELIPTPSPAPEAVPSLTPEAALSPAPEAALSPAPVPLTAFYAEVGAELPGYWDLVSLHTEEDEFSDELLARLRQLGMPMILDLREDGSAVLGIFDRAIAMEMDLGRMLVFSEGKTLPFFYLDGRLRIQDGALFMIFERRT